jgi:3-hydroxyacyl-[acyl-carrier-protein] dehydratase
VLSAPRTSFFLTINKAKFRKPVRPGDTLEYHVEKLAQRRNMYWYGCQAKVRGSLVAEAELGAYLDSIAD